MFDAFIYISRAEREFSPAELCELAEFAEVKNARTGVTGYLFFDRGRFLQYIEGEKGPLDELIVALSRDERHAMVASARDQRRTTRRFPRWHMRWLLQVDLAEIQMEHLVVDQLQLVHDCDTTGASDWQRSVWRMADTLARLHGGKRRD